jgi:hypothetical protein
MHGYMQLFPKISATHNNNRLFIQSCMWIESKIKVSCNIKLFRHDINQYYSFLVYLS